MAEVLGALSLATDLGTGQSLGSVIHACYLGMQLSRELGLAAEAQIDVYYGTLLFHSGCSSLSYSMGLALQSDELAALGALQPLDPVSLREMLPWMLAHVSPQAPLPARLLDIFRMALDREGDLEARRGVCEIAVRVAQRLGLPTGVQQTLLRHLERWDGQGPYGLRGDEIPLAARILPAALILEACRALRGPEAVEAFALAQKAKMFDPQVVEAFLRAARQPGFWDALAQEDAWDTVVALEPASPHRDLDASRLDDVALAIADLVDIKTPANPAHSRETARLAEAMARALRLEPEQVAEVRRAALVHDMGLVAVPSQILHKAGALTAAEQERLRLHPYYTERILARVPALRAVAAIAGAHHERLDGSGYYRGLAGNALPLSAGILAVADEFQDRQHATPAAARDDPRPVLEGVRAQSGTLFRPECVDALAQALGLAAAPKPPREAWPAGLTGREVEVLRLLVRGLSNRQMAEALVISPKTAGHHVQHIYDKIGVSSRAAAVFWALEHEIVT
jgi:HD-GYP domain-containing protein (c-di-GMP phosphodiesterase class II)/DNA-binding CsgD family transcriptional regulator